MNRDHPLTFLDVRISLCPALPFPATCAVAVLGVVQACLDLDMSKKTVSLQEFFRTNGPPGTYNNNLPVRPRRDRCDAASS